MRITRDDDCLTIAPNEGDHSASIILMHGLGDTCDGWSDVAEQLAHEMKHIKFILPTAKSIPVTMNGGYRMPAWYDIQGLDERANEFCEGLSDSRARIEAIMEKENQLGVNYNRIILAGFSQGGALALSTGLQLPIEKKVAGLVVFSGYLPGIKSFNFVSGNENLPVLHCHGTSDNVVQYNNAEKTKGHLVSLGMNNYVLNPHAGLQHSINEKVLDQAREFISKHLPHDATLNIPPKDPSTMSVKELKIAVRDRGLASKAVGFTEKSEFVALLKEHM